MQTITLDTTDTTHIPPSRRAKQKAGAGLVLLVVLTAAFAINLDGTIVNVALPSLNHQLGASTSSLQWVVDGYNLAFAALVLAGGNIGDRYGRRKTLVAGLGLFSVASVVAAACNTIGELIATRFVMGAAAALIFPTTLSIITNTFPDRQQRAKAIGAWGGVTGLGVAVGPVAGGFLLDHFWWGSVFLALVPVALVGILGAVLLIPETVDKGRPALDRLGLGLSVLGLGVVVYSIIEAPTYGWGSARTIGGLIAGVAVLGVFAAVERRKVAPMLDVRLFANLRFSAASGSVTVAFFALYGFIFLITQFMQELRGYSPLSTGVRILPVAVSIAIGSLLGTQLAVKWGNKLVVASGLLLLVASYSWIGVSPGDVSYSLIVGQMILMGLGLGFTTAPATESIMGVVRADQAGAGSAVNDATRELGGTLGVAVIGSVFASLYGSHLGGGHVAGVPHQALAAARNSFGAGLAVTNRLVHAGSPAASSLHSAVHSGFMAGLHAGCFTAAAVCFAGAVFVAVMLPSKPGQAA